MSNKRIIWITDNFVNFAIDNRFTQYERLSFAQLLHPEHNIQYSCVHHCSNNHMNQKFNLLGNKVYPIVIAVWTFITNISILDEMDRWQKLQLKCIFKK